MQLLLGLETSDILYFATNTRTQWQRARIGKGNFVCRQPFDWQQDILSEMVSKSIEIPMDDINNNNVTNATNSTTTSKMETSYFSIDDYLSNDPEWFSQNYADYVFYQAANQTLDRTILQIGLDVYATALKDFRRLLRQAHDSCMPHFGCSNDGLVDS